MITAGVEMSEEDRTIKGPHLKMKGRLSRQEYAKLRVPSMQRQQSLLSQGEPEEKILVKV